MDEELRREAEFWENYDLKSLQYGTPYWVDLQNADYLKTPKRYIWCDPNVEKILYGDVKNELFTLLPQRSVRILDVGCGAGWLSLELARRGHHVTGIDIAAKRVEIAIETAAREGVSIDYRTISLEELDLPNHFDVIVCYGSLHHFPRISEAVSKIRSLLKDHGLFLLVENSGNKIRDGVEWCRKVILKRDENSRSPYEDVSTKTLVAEVEKIFRVEKKTHDLAFSKIVAEVCFFVFPNLGSQYLYPLLHLCRRLDRVASCFGVPQGEIIFMQAYKK